MIWPKYELFRRKYADTNRLYMDLLSQKAEIFAMTQPAGVDTTREAVEGGGAQSVYDSYMIALESSKIDERIVAISEIREEQGKMLKSVEHALRKSAELEDKIYRMRYLDHLKVYRIAMLLNYSEPQIYRILRKITKAVKGGGSA